MLLTSDMLQVLDRLQTDIDTYLCEGAETTDCLTPIVVCSLFFMFTTLLLNVQASHCVTRPNCASIDRSIERGREFWR